jgi:Ca-activated chloride channel family protein
LGASQGSTRALGSGLLFGMRSAWLSLLIAIALGVAGCRRAPDVVAGASIEAGALPEIPPLPPPAPKSVELDVIFSSEKKDWANEAFNQFNASAVRTDDGRAIHVKASYTGSVEPIDGIVAGSLRPHVFSPASSLVLPLLEDQWMGAKGATAKPIVASAEALVLSPVVVAMWEPMARALGWPARKIGWHDIASLARSADGWRGRGHPEWGDFRFGHTHPEYSNSGLISVLAEAYAGAGKTRDLSVADVGDPRTKQFLHDVESAVVHYGRSTGFFYDALAHHGPSYLSAAVLYENLVVASTSDEKLPFPLVCLYPREGTQWADHPYAVLDAPWVGPAERDAAGKLKAFLLSRAVQQSAMERFGFRPALTDIALGAPIDAAHGADPKEPQTLLAAPGVRVVRALLDTWNENKRGVEIVIVFDRSGSMAGTRLRAARDGLLAFLGRLRADDRVVLMTFNGKLDPPTPTEAPSLAVPRVQSIFAEGETALYDAILRGRELAESAAKSDKHHIHAVVVLTDGEDNQSHVKLQELLDKLTPTEQANAVRVFTIGYGGQASDAVLKQIAARTGAVYYHGDVDNIRAVYEEIASFF